MNDYPERLPRAIKVEGGATFGKGVKTQTLLNYLKRLEAHDKEPWPFKITPKGIEFLNGEISKEILNRAKK